jgi:hypothetical protein
MTTTVRYFAPLVWQGGGTTVALRQAAPVVWSQQSVSAYIRNLSAIQWFKTPTPVTVRKVTALQWSQDNPTVTVRKVTALQWTQDSVKTLVRGLNAITWATQPTNGSLRQVAVKTLQQSSTSGSLRQVRGATLQLTRRPQTVGGLAGLWALIVADAKVTLQQAQVSISAAVADSSLPYTNTYVTVAPIGALLQQYSGSTKLYYNRVGMDRAFLTSGVQWLLGTISAATTIRALIPRINTAYSISLDPTDVVDGPVSAGATAIQLTAAPGGYVFNPGTSVWLQNTVALSVALPYVNLPGFADANGNGPTLSYSATVLADAPYAYYRLSETSGTVAADSSGNNRNGVYTGALTLASAPLLTSANSKYVSFPGSNSAYVDVTAAKNFCAGTQWTVEAWVNVASYATKGGYTGSAGGPSIITDVGDTGSTTPATGFELSLLTFGNTQQGYYYWPKDNLSSASTATPLPVVGTVAHLVFTYNAGTLSMYKNGVLIQTFTGATAATIRTFLRIGATSWVGGPMNGLIGEVALYTTALSLARIQAHYNAR